MGCPNFFNITPHKNLNYQKPQKAKWTPLDTKEHKNLKPQPPKKP
jgi:hypothetical protein